MSGVAAQPDRNGEDEDRGARNWCSQELVQEAVMWYNLDYIEIRRFRATAE